MRKKGQCCKSFEKIHLKRVLFKISSGIDKYREKTSIINQTSLQYIWAIKHMIFNMNKILPPAEEDWRRWGFFYLTCGACPEKKAYQWNDFAIDHWTRVVFLGRTLDCYSMWHISWHAATIIFPHHINLSYLKLWLALLECCWGNHGYFSNYFLVQLTSYLYLWLNSDCGWSLLCIFNEVRIIVKFYDMERVGNWFHGQFEKWWEFDLHRWLLIAKH